MNTKNKIECVGNAKLLVLMIVLVLLSQMASAQVDFRAIDSLSKSKTERYVGYTLSFASKYSVIESNIPQLDGMSLRREGGSVGVLVGNDIGTWRAAVGMYYSAPSVPYSVDVAEAEISKTVYWLRMSSQKKHTFEPYGLMTAKVIRSSFFGNIGDNGKKTYGANERLAGRVLTSQVMAGVGVEYQMVSENLEFIHLFAEARYGLSIDNHSRSEAFDQTSIKRPMSFTLGIAFGHIK